MRLLALLLGLWVERYQHWGDQLRRFNWFPCYVAYSNKLLGKTPLWQGPIQTIATILLPVLIGIAILYSLSGLLFFGIIKFLFSTFIFIYCLGPKDIFLQVNRYLAPSPTTQKATQPIDLFEKDVPQDPIEANKVLLNAVLFQANERLFAVIFWFTVFGPVGAVLYRMSALLRHLSSAPGSAYEKISKFTVLIHDILDWVPARLTAICYAITGSFSQASGFWFDTVISGTDKNREILQVSGQKALRLKDDAGVTAENIHSAMTMIDRSVVAYLIGAAILIAAVWLVRH